jgi:CPA1 family monovalent cation:H+ antiporter
VLAVLALGLLLRQSAHSAITARGWVLGRAVWEYADFLITSLVFVLLGYELTSVIGHTSSDVNTLLLAGAVLATAIVVRPLWVFPAAALAEAASRRKQDGIPFGWRETTVVSWAGMRGVVTVATALALPAASTRGDLGWRNAVVLAAFGCVLVTLVAQGLTLGPLIKVLKVGTETDEPAEIRRLRGEAIEAALDRLGSDGGDDPAVATVVASYRARLDTQRAVAAVVESGTSEDMGSGAADRLREAFQRASAAEREYVLGRRSGGAVSPAAADHVLLEIETRAAQTGDA